MSLLNLEFGFARISVSDFTRATAFYTGVLELEEEFAAEEYGWAQYKVGSATLCLSVLNKAQFPTDDKALGGNTARIGADTGIQLRVADARAAYALVKSRGVVVGDLHVGDDGTTSFGVLDPDGNKLSIAQIVTG